MPRPHKRPLGQQCALRSGAPPQARKRLIFSIGGAGISTINMIPSLRELRTVLFNEENCIQFLFEKGILYTSKSCHSCNGAVRIEGKLWRCKRSNCRKTTSIFKDSFFATSKLQCCDVLLIGYLWLCKSSYSSILQMTGHSSATITDYIGFFRDLVAGSLNDEDTIIGGEGIIVEVDESKLGKRKYNRGHRVDGVWVVGGVERTAERRAFLVSVQNRSAETLHEIIARHIHPGSVLHTDLWRGYCGVEEKHDLEHRTVNHFKNFKDPQTGVHTNTIEGTWNGLKLMVSPRNRTENIDDHLFEFLWRRKYGDDLWEGFLLCLKDTAYID
jgi:transposase-like protein